MRTKAFKHSNIHLPKLERNFARQRINRKARKFNTINARKSGKTVKNEALEENRKIGITPDNRDIQKLNLSRAYGGRSARAEKMKYQDEMKRVIEVGEKNLIKSFDNPENTLMVDFDGTIVKQHDDHTHPHEFELRDGAKEGLDTFHEQGRKIIIWTSHPNHEEIVKFLNKNHIHFDGIERKPEFFRQIDDKVIEATQSWENIMKEVPDPPRQPSEHSYSYHTLKFKANEAVREFFDFLEHLKCPIVGLDNYAAMAHAVEDPEHVIVFGGLKSEAKAHEKVNRDYDGDWSRLLDILRATVVMDTPECLYEALDEAEEKWELVRKQDKTHDPIAEPHILTNWALPCGIIAEVQWFLKPHFLKWRQLAGEVPQEHISEIQNTLVTKQLDMDEDRGPQELTDKTNEGLDTKAYKHPSKFHKLERNVLKRNENRYRAKEDAAARKQHLGHMSRDALHASVPGREEEPSEYAIWGNTAEHRAQRYVRRNKEQQGRAHHRLMPSPRHWQREGTRASELRSGETHRAAKLRRESGVRKPHESNPVYGVKELDNAEKAYRNPSPVSKLDRNKEAARINRQEQVIWNDREFNRGEGRDRVSKEDIQQAIAERDAKKGIELESDGEKRSDTPLEEFRENQLRKDDRKRAAYESQSIYSDPKTGAWRHGPPPRGNKDTHKGRYAGDEDPWGHEVKGVELPSDGEKRVRRTYGSTRSAYASMFAGRRQQDLQQRPGKLNIFGTKRRLAGKMATRGPTVPKEMFPEKAKEERYKRKSIEDGQKDLGPHEFGTTQFNITGEIADKIRAMTARISDEDLAEDGREEECHVTVKYGLHTDDPQEVAERVHDFGVVEISLGTTSLFTTDDEYDVVKIDVVGGRLHELNHLISGTMEATDTHKDYAPHITLAYVKKGEGKKYAGMSDVAGLKVYCNELIFSSADGERTTIPLCGDHFPLDDEALKRAKAADLVRLPPHLRGGQDGTACSSCIFVQLKNNYCNHEKLKMVLPYDAKEMCCKYWDAPNTGREWEEKAYHVNQIDPEKGSQPDPELITAKHRGESHSRSPQGGLYRASRNVYRTSAKYSFDPEGRREYDIQKSDDAPTKNKAFKHSNINLPKLHRNVLKDKWQREDQRLISKIAAEKGKSPKQVAASDSKWGSLRGKIRGTEHRRGMSKQEISEFRRGGSHRAHQMKKEWEAKSYYPRYPKLERNASIDRENRQVRKHNTIKARETGRTVRSQATQHNILSARQLMREPAYSGAVQRLHTEGRPGESRRAAKMRRDEEYKGIELPLSPQALPDQTIPNHTGPDRTLPYPTTGKAMSYLNETSGGSLVQTSLGPKIPRREHVHQPMPEKRKMRQNTDEMEHVIHHNEGGYGPSVRPVDLRESLLVRKKAFKHSNINLPKLERNAKKERMNRVRQEFAAEHPARHPKDVVQGFGRSARQIQRSKYPHFQQGELRSGESHRAAKMRREHGKSFDIPMLGSKSAHTAATELGHYGGKVGGPARARKLSAARRREIAKMGGKARQRMKGK